MSDQNKGPSPDKPASDAIVWSVVGTLLAGPALYGLIGYGVDTWVGTSVFLPIGVIVGFVLSMYIVFVRYGRG